MVDITVKITGQCVETQVRGELVSGMVGAPVTFAFDPQWDGLEVVAVFRANGTVRDVALDNSGRTTVPWEVLQWAHTKLEVGVEGRNKDGTVVIPTLWGVVGKISPGAKVSGNPAAQPTPTQYDRLLKEIRRVEDSVPGWAKEPEKPKYTASEVGALASTELQNAVNVALTQAKESGEFDGQPGADGKDYVLTEADKQEIAEQAAELVEVPESDLSGLVKSVNGVSPDENGNVQITIPDSGQNATMARAQIEALDGMFQIAAYTENPVAKYSAFKTAFGLNDNDNPDEVPATSVVLSANTLNFADTNSQTLTATVEPSDSTDAVVWKSSNNAIATVANGVVTPVSDGSCTITATAGSVSAECVVTVAIEQEVITYKVNNYLTNVTNSNIVTTVNSGSVYTATLTAADGYAINKDSVVISMNGTEITDTAYNAETGVISIAAVTGDISITATGDVSNDWDFEWDYTMGLMSENGFTASVSESTKDDITVTEELRDDGVYLGVGNNDTLVMSPTGHETMESGVMEITFNAQACGDRCLQFWMSNGETGCTFAMSNTQWIFGNGWAANKAYQNEYTIRIEFNKDGTHSLYSNATSDTATKTSTLAENVTKTGIRVYHSTSIIIKSVKYKWSV